MNRWCCFSPGIRIHAIDIVRPRDIGFPPSPSWMCTDDLPPALAAMSGDETPARRRGCRASSILLISPVAS